MAGRFGVVGNFKLAKKEHVRKKWKALMVAVKALEELWCVEKNDLTFDDNTISDDVLWI